MIDVTSHEILDGAGIAEGVGQEQARQSHRHRDVEEGVVRLVPSHG